MLEFSAEEFLKDIQIEIVAIPDFADDESRKNYILKNISDFQYVISGNPWVQNVFRDTKEIIPIEIRKAIKGSTIRSQIATDNIWSLKDLLADKVIKYLQEIQASQRLREIFNKERKTPNIVVDVVLTDKDGSLILIERKNFPKGIALPGWFNNYGEIWIAAAKREVKEEVWVDISIERELWIWDKPDRDPRSHNISRVFKAKITTWVLKAGEEIKNIIKINIEDLDKIDFAFPDHKEMISKAFLE